MIWIGAILVLEGKMTIGQLIAFRILSGYVTSPLLRLTSLWQNFQETSLSLERLSDIVDHPNESENSGSPLPPLPPIAGAIIFENINFRFTPASPLKLTNINLEIPAGHFVGITGTSGSGKRSLIKLLTRLFPPSNGVIKKDGYDISKVDLYSLRTQIGVVPQDCLLFNGTVQQNIALAKPDASFTDICKVSRMADAHNFIQGLDLGYNTLVGEKGSNLSGGQRQRIVIARSLLTEAKVLLLDEATSSLDIDSERRVINNIRDTYSDRTVIFISHRLANIKDADQILVLHNGSISERGKHQDLLQLNGRYKTLYQQQGESINV